MSSSSNSNLIAALNSASMQINFSFGIFTYVFGIVGNLMNICVLSQRTLRSNPCAWLFLVSSAFYGLGIVAGLTPRVLSTWNLDLTDTNNFICKLRTFFLFPSITIGPWLIMFAAVDRWLSSNTHAYRRRKSTLKNAQIGTIVIVIIITMIQCPQVYCYEANQINAPVKCYSKTVSCSMLSDLYMALLTIIVPIAVMLTFGLMTISNIHLSRSRVQQMQSTTNGGNNRTATTGHVCSISEQRKTDRRLLLMLLAQVFMMCVFTFPLAVTKIYTTMTRFYSKSLLQITIENFIFNLCIIIFNLYCGMPFYIYALSGGHLFRRAIVRCFKLVYQMLIRRQG